MLINRTVNVKYMDENGTSLVLGTSVTYNEESGVVTCNYERAKDIKCFINCRDGARVAWCTLEDLIIGKGYSDLGLDDKWVRLYSISLPFPKEKAVLIHGNKYTAPDLVEEFKGEKYYKPYFKNIGKELYPDSIEINESEPILSYILSCHGNQNRYILNKYKEFKDFVDAKTKYGFHITKEAGIFICEK